MMAITLPQRYITLLNFLLVAIIVYFLAQSVSAAVRFHLAGERATGPAMPGGATPLPQTTGILPRAYYDAIVRRDIFDLAPVRAVPVESENLNITLIGTSHMSGGRPFIVVEDSDGAQALYRLGENIPNTGRVIAIGRNRAIILHHGHRVGIEIPNQDRGGAPDAPAEAPYAPFFHRPMVHPLPRYGTYGAGPSGVRRVSANQYDITRATVDSKLSNLPALFTQIRAVPNLQNGSSDGFRLSEIQPGSIFEQIGLQDGDVVTAAQGQPVSDPMQAMQLLSQLRDSPSITLSVIRDGTPLQLHYSIY